MASNQLCACVCDNETKLSNECQFGPHEKGNMHTEECVCEDRKHPWIKRLLIRLGIMGRQRKEAGSTGSDASVSSDITDKAPDGGWGWAVCFGSFLVNFILDGTMFSFGVLLLTLLDYFGQGKSKTSWIGSSLLGMSMFMGPIVSILLEKYTCRQITIVGTLISVVAFVASTFSPNVDMLIVTYGIIGGVGFSMSFISAIIIVGLYFNRKRAIATGIAMSGSGLGTFAYAYLTDYLINKFDWRGTILILSGILLNGMVCGILFRPIDDDLHRTASGSETGSDSNSNDSSDMEELKQLLKSKNFEALNRTRHQQDKNYLHASLIPARLTMSTDLAHVQKSPITADVLDVREISSHGDLVHLRKRVIKNQMSKRDIFYSGSVVHLHGRESEPSLASSEAPNCSSTSWKDVLKSNCNLFKNKIFILLLVTNVCWTVQSVPLTYIPDLGVSKELETSDAALLISIVGITNIIGRILSGLITDLLGVRSTLTYIGALFTASVVNFLFPWCYNFATLAACSGVFGFCMATAVSMRTIVLADHLGMDKLTRAFGMVALFQGIAFLTNAPLGGFLYEQFNSYVMPFSFAGLMYFISAVCCLAVQCLDREDRTRFEITVECPPDPPLKDT